MIEVVLPTAADSFAAPQSAEVAELADAHGSGPCTRKGVGVRVPSSAPSPFLAADYADNADQGGCDYFRNFCERRFAVPVAGLRVRVPKFLVRFFFPGSLTVAGKFL